MISRISCDDHVDIFTIKAAELWGSMDIYR